MPIAKTKQPALKGGCRCGEIRYVARSAPLFSFACHCTDCQQLTSGAFSLGLTVPRDSFEVTKGEPRIWTKIADSGKPSHQYSCPNCAGWTHTLAEGSSEIIILRPTTLDNHKWVRPVGEIFTRSALPWATLATALSYETEFDDTQPLIDAFQAADLVPGS
ncbi:GFA family protein [Novosphingopyxis sp. YJ-S2-01]|uniref:GFA family protein n=1 Tax=Novosphingopyxis sp. YJ-S2-01 TaxID=2794021 RepID=UPI0018DBE3CC|nr:GFA family protein [Novosphingopyxis sp. YJ-S2-01]MBH9537895.1 GFA family protein [Novosphingopyxis sp. YJ-S2-01]